jgi:hypothetical protein
MIPREGVAPPASRWLSVGGLAWLAATAIVAGAGAANAPDGTTRDTEIIAVELNRAESLTDGCRLSLVIHNRTSHAFETMQWDLFFFDPAGRIAARMAAEAAPLPAGKTSVKLFDVPGLACEGLGRVLINDVLRCETDSGAGIRIDCLRLTVPSSRAQVELFK